MKKVSTIALTLTLLFALSACTDLLPGNNSSAPAASSPAQSTPAVSTPTQEQEPAVATGTTFTLERCVFTDTVHAADDEFIGSAYTERTDRVYIDIVLRPSNPYGQFSSDNFRAFTMYEGRRYDFQYCVEGIVATSMDSSADDGQFVPRLHLFTLVPASAESAGDLTVTCTINGKEQNLSVAKKSAPATLENKTEVKVGDKHSLFDGLVEFEVVDCKYADTLLARDIANSEQYTFYKPFLDVTLKVTNNTDWDLWGFLLPYMIIDDEIHRGTEKEENDAGTEVGTLTSLQPGQTKYIHLIQTLSEEQVTQENTMRFNLLGNCYYCVATPKS